MKITDLFEMMEPGSVKDITWKGDTGFFTVGDTLFDATIRPAKSDEEQTFLQFFDTVPKVGNVDYGATGPDGVRTQDLTGRTGKQTVTVYSSIADICRHLIQKHHYEILLIIAKQESSPTQFQDRVDHYSRLSYYAAKKFGMMDMCLTSQPSYTTYAVFKPAYVSNMHNIRQHLETHYQTK
jgi:hypothetical protein